MKKFTITLVVVAILVVAYLVYDNSNSTLEQTNENNDTTQNANNKTVEYSETYRNQKLGFETRYASGYVWGKINDYSVQMAYPDSKWTFAVEAIPNDKKLTLEQAFDEEVKGMTEAYLQLPNEEGMTIQTSDVIVDGVAGKKLVIKNFGDVGNARVTVVKNNKIYRLFASQGESWVTEENDIKTLIANFKFLN